MVNRAILSLLIEVLGELQLGLKRKPLFSFSRKAKIGENSLNIRKISQNFCSGKIFNFAKVFAKIYVFADVFFVLVLNIEASERILTLVPS
jgi:hypothetical protein